ncbi:MAG: hypothetical protein GTO63_30175 [Anaerolineae bacterium]|nr:hypothetical protein [Anaerolineae bacterium]NIN98972.1 hypothetical protein [Anaerolineae bacterium]
MEESTTILQFTPEALSEVIQISLMAGMTAAILVSSGKIIPDDGWLLDRAIKMQSEAREVDFIRDFAGPNFARVFIERLASR